MEHVNNYRIEIKTGQYKPAPPEEKAMIQYLLGENVEYNFELYFHWYNLVHELGHAVFEFNSALRPHPADEEQLVNDFAVAYWRHYGEREKFNDLCSIVKETAGRFTTPTQRNISYMEYAKEVWGKKELYNFNNYGWFQFHCVQTAMDQQQTLEQAICSMGISPIQPQGNLILSYNIDDKMAFRVVADAVKELKKWGIRLPKTVDVILSDDPNCHMCQSKRIEAK